VRALPNTRAGRTVALNKFPGKPKAFTNSRGVFDWGNTKMKSGDEIAAPVEELRLRSVARPRRLCRRRNGGRCTRAPAHACPGHGAADRRDGKAKCRVALIVS
jgi:hypothetical protein